MRCLTSVRFNMTATVLNYAPDAEHVDDAIAGGHFEVIQDPDTGAIQKIWVEDQTVATTDEDKARQIINRFDIPCLARGFTELGFRSSANTQSFNDGVYQAVEVIQVTFPAQYQLNRNQFITNIRGRDKRPLWIEEETGQPTVFEVQGVTPTFDPFGRHMANIAVVNRSVIQ
jgi:hypothetical protein